MEPTANRDPLLNALRARDRERVGEAVQGSKSIVRTLLIAGVVTIALVLIFRAIGIWLQNR